MHFPNIAFYYSGNEGAQPLTYKQWPAALNAYRVFSFYYYIPSYSGPCCKIRRSSDNALQDINFTAAGYIDIAALQAFIGSDSAYLDTFYDQSGNAQNRFETVAAFQPRIADAGVINNFNGFVFLEFYNGSSRLLSAANFMPGNTNFSSFNVYTKKQAGNAILWQAGINQFAIVQQNGSGANSYNQLTTKGNDYIKNSFIASTSRDQMFDNIPNETFLTHDAINYGLQNFWTDRFYFGGYGTYGGGAFSWQGFYFEEVIFLGDQTAILAQAYADRQANYKNLL